MAGVLDLPHAAAVDATRGWLLGLDRSGMITELHVRDVTPSDVRLLLVEGIGAITSRDTTLDALRGLGRERGVPVSVARSVD